MDVEQPEQQDAYIALLLYVSSSDTPDDTPRYRESYVLVRAGSEEQARDKAHTYALHPVSDEDGDGEQVRWRLKHLVDLSPVAHEGVQDGTDICGRFFDDYPAYRRAYGRSP